MNTLRLLIYVGPTILFVVYGQLIIKWRIGMLGVVPADGIDKLIFLLRALLDPYIASGVIAAFLGSLAWLAAVSKIPLNVGFPVYYGLTFILIIVGSAWLLNEPVTNLQMIGAILILLGVIIGSMG